MSRNRPGVRRRTIGTRAWQTIFSQFSETGARRPGGDQSRPLTRYTPRDSRHTHLIDVDAGHRSDVRARFQGLRVVVARERAAAAAGCRARDDDQPQGRPQEQRSREAHVDVCWRADAATTATPRPDDPAGGVGRLNFLRLKPCPVNRSTIIACCYLGTELRTSCFARESRRRSFFFFLPRLSFTARTTVTVSRATNNGTLANRWPV